jgi:hypothetical protein
LKVLIFKHNDPESLEQVLKTPFLRLFYTTTDHFTKTGSGQT